ncbi:thioesterase [Phycicoccus jejuensis]|uniref:thioesterase family protein n=1 Tax=Phycicoccus TaxID=367298 RepID=UPI0004C2EC9C|nr:MULTISPECIES: hotdog domain-containing protein [Phycicoccus]GIL36980.1 hypothetical protein PDTK01_30550 [Phycicoccus sp. DTK01]
MDTWSGRTAEETRTVAPGDTARSVGSGDLPVLGTPRLLAWLEAATVAAVADVLGPGATSVGTRVELEHSAPSAVGEQVTVRAEVVGHDGRRLRFAVQAHDAAGRILAAGTVERVVVDAARFVDRLGRG